MRLIITRVADPEPGGSGCFYKGRIRIQSFLYGRMRVTSPCFDLSRCWTKYIDVYIIRKKLMVISINRIKVEIMAGSWPRSGFGLFLKVGSISGSGSATLILTLDESGFCMELSGHRRSWKQLNQTIILWMFISLIK